MALPDSIPFSSADGGPLPRPTKPTPDGDASRDIGSLIEELHQNARDNRLRIEEIERENQSLQAQLETTKAELQNARAREIELRSKFTEITSLIKERDKVVAANEAHLKTIASLKAQLDAAAQAGKTRAPQPAVAGGEAGAAQLLGIRQARDAAQQNATALAAKLEAAENQVADLEYAREGEQKQLEVLSKEAAELRQQLETLRIQHGEQAGNDEKAGALELELTAARQREKELEQIQREEGDKVRNLTKRGEEHRKLAIDLAAQLDAARREMMEMTANLAEARLQTKFANAKTAGSTPGLAIPSAAPENTVASSNAEPLNEQDATNLLNAMIGCLEAFCNDPSEINPINEIYGHANTFSERARISGMVALYRLSYAFASLANHLIEIPDALNPSTVGTMKQTIEFLLALVQEGNLTGLQDPAKARIYAVDDEPENCELMAMGLDMVMLSTVYSTESVAALTQLASGSFDLIFLDINLPGMNGFALCTEIRKMPNYTKTPIVFVTGMDSPEYRSQSILSGGNDFISKPFNLHELNVKALTLILTAQLSA